MEKDFDGWNKRKQELERGTHAPFCHKREVWWCVLGVNVGREQNGAEWYQRPVIILKNLGPEMCLVVPLTTSGKPHPLRISVGKINDRENYAMIGQLKTVDTKRMADRISYLNKESFMQIRNAVKAML